MCFRNWINKKPGFNPKRASSLANNQPGLPESPGHAAWSILHTPGTSPTSTKSHRCLLCSFEDQICSPDLLELPLFPPLGFYSLQLAPFLAAGKPSSAIALLPSSPISRPGWMLQLEHAHVPKNPKKRRGFMNRDGCCLLEPPFHPVPWAMAPFKSNLFQSLRAKQSNFTSFQRPLYLLLSPQSGKIFQWCNQLNPLMTTRQFTGNS